MAFAEEFQPQVARPNRLSLLIHISAQVTYTSSEVLYSPPRASQPQLGQSGALQDEAADSAWRPYHRILVPTDANVTLPRAGASPQTLDWCVLGIMINVLGRALQGQQMRDLESADDY